MWHAHANAFIILIHNRGVEILFVFASAYKHHRPPDAVPKNVKRD